MEERREPVVAVDAIDADELWPAGWDETGARAATAMAGPDAEGGCTEPDGLRSGPDAGAGVGCWRRLASADEGGGCGRGGGGADTRAASGELVGCDCRRGCGGSADGGAGPEVWRAGGWAMPGLGAGTPEAGGAGG